MQAEMSARAYSPRAMSEPERGPTPPVRAYKLVPINEPTQNPQEPQQQRTHYSDTEAPMPPQRHSPPSPAPQDHMISRDQMMGGGDQHMEDMEEYVGESDMEQQQHDCDMDSTVAGQLV